MIRDNGWLSASRSSLRLRSPTPNRRPRARMSDDPEVERKRPVVLPPGFELQLVASEPAVINPVRIQR